jgi:hypothetical protein
MDQHTLIDLLAGTAVIVARAQRTGDKQLLKAWTKARPKAEQAIIQEFIALVKTTSAILNARTN